MGVIIVFLLILICVSFAKSTGGLIAILGILSIIFFGAIIHNNIKNKPLKEEKENLKIECEELLRKRDLEKDPDKQQAIIDKYMELNYRINEIDQEMEKLK